MTISEAFKILGVNYDNSLEEIKSKYRKMAKQYHPDIYSNNDATSKMQEINEAYSYIIKHYSEPGNKRGNNKQSNTQNTHYRHIDLNKQLYEQYAIKYGFYTKYVDAKRLYNLLNIKYNFRDWIIYYFGEIDNYAKMIGMDVCEIFIHCCSKGVGTPDNEKFVDFLKYIVDKTDVCKDMYMKYATMYDVDTRYEDVRMMFRCLKVCNTFENWLTNDFKIITYYAKIMEIDAFDLFFMYFSKHRPCSSEQFINFLKNTIDNLQSNDNNRHK